MQNWADIQTLLETLNSTMNPSELHGILCGRYLGGHALEDKFGLRIVAQVTDSNVAQIDDSRDAWLLFTRNLLAQFEDQFQFYPLVPSDDEALSIRLESLAEWCSGFLSGIGQTMTNEIVAKDSDLRELMADFIEISRLDSDVEASEENETYYAQLVEYVRLATFNVKDEKLPDDDLNELALGDGETRH